MKKILFTFTAVALLFSFNVASGEDTAANMYKTYCQNCHGADGSRAASKGVPLIKGQNSDELLKMLVGYKNGTFGGPKKQAMEGVVKRLTEDQLKILAGYIPTL